MYKLNLYFYLRPIGKGEKEDMAKIPMDKMPLYQKIINQLYQEISSGVYKEGSLLPTETEIMQRFNASRTTVRNALSNLVEENIIYRRPGKGSFVKRGMVGEKTQMNKKIRQDAVPYSSPAKRYPT